VVVKVRNSLWAAELTIYFLAIFGKGWCDGPNGCAQNKLDTGRLEAAWDGPGF
jgi:hypothetical protein